ncbi:mitochondrial import inner membrane translocase subunit Tim29 [Hydra vulgaris]|uniref:mitochondrial import inner membrane translocase subunit Tim29 n=1 Tax=Hydra vulgaris TaxID=6087 RepID=UPI001F5EDB91|nr:mitochondrial import inner membrane translocase subunit Tim29 [Hydra vulgaris]
MTILGRVWKINHALFPQFESLKQGRLAKVFVLYHDYKQAFLDTYKYVRTKPIRASCYLTVLGFSFYAYKNNPNFQSYRDTLLEASNQHSCISDLIRNKKSNAEIKRLMKLYSEERLRIWNFGIFSLIMINPYSEVFDAFEKHCSTIENRWNRVDTWKKRIVDIGFINRWILMEKIMLDFDINDDEFS